MFERPSIQALSKHGVYWLIIIFSFNGNFWWMPYFLRKVNPLGIEDTEHHHSQCEIVAENGKMGHGLHHWATRPRPMRPASLDPHRPCTAYFAAGGERFSTQPGRNGNGSEILNHENASLNIQIIQNGGSNMFD